MQWVQDPKQSNADDPSNVRYEANGHFRNKGRNVWMLKLMNLLLKLR